MSTVDKNLYKVGDRIISVSTTTQDKNLYKVGDLVQHQGRSVRRDDALALVIEKTPDMKRYRIKWCQSGQAIWVWGYVLAPAY